MGRPMRNSAQLANLDFNLLVSLDVLLQERSVTRAATRLGLSQPTLSAALARLRRHFGDELLTRVGNHYEHTPLAAELATRTSGAVSMVEQIFAGPPEFDPRNTDREFTVVASDYVVAVLGRALAVALRERAPGVPLRLEQLRANVVETAPETLRAVDGLVLPHGFLSRFPHVDLFTDRWVFVAAEDNPEIGDRLTLDELARLPMVLSYQGPNGFIPAARQLSMLGVEPRVELVAETFLALPFLVSGTDRIGLIPERLARRLAAVAEVRVLACPFEAVRLVEALWWHPMHDGDAGHRWLREVFAEVAGKLDGEQPG